MADTGQHQVNKTNNKSILSVSTHLVSYLGIVTAGLHILHSSLEPANGMEAISRHGVRPG